MTPVARLAGGMLLVMATLTGVATSAWGYWTSTGTGTGSASTATLDPPTGTTATALATTVDVSWSAPTTGVDPQGYNVTRTLLPSGASAPACGASTITGTSCTDSGVPPGTYRYTVTAVLASWRAAGDPSPLVVVTSAPVDTTAPTVAAVSAAATDGSYRAGDQIPITVSFDEPVDVTGTPQITLVTGSPATTPVGYTSGSGTTTLTFTYTVAAGHATADLAYESTGSLALAGGTIRDAAGNNATLTLPAPGAPTSLSGSKDLVIDTAAPTVLSIARAGASPTNAGPLSWTVTFSEPVTGVQAASFTLTLAGIGGATPTITAPTPVGAAPAASWTVLASTTGTTGSDAGSIRLDLTGVDTVTDAAGNALAAGTLQGEPYAYDTTAPSVLITGIPSVGGSGKVRVTGTGTIGLPVTVTLCFSVTPPPVPFTCTQANATKVMTIAALTATTWQSPNSDGRATGTWFASATQVDPAGNETTAVFGPVAN